MCYIHLREFRKAVDEMRKVVEIVPHRAMFRVNLSLYSSYAGDFQSGEREARLATGLGKPRVGLVCVGASPARTRSALCKLTDSYQELAQFNARESSTSCARSR